MAFQLMRIESLYSPRETSTVMDAGPSMLPTALAAGFLWETLPSLSTGFTQKLYLRPADDVPASFMKDAVHKPVEGSLLGVEHMSSVARIQSPSLP